MARKVPQNSVFGDALVYLRKHGKAKPLTQVELAKQLQITQGALANLENSRRQPTDDLLQRIAVFFGYSKSDTEDLLRRLRRHALVQRNPEMAQLFEPRTATAHRGQYLPLHIRSELNRMIDAKPGGLEGISSFFDVPFEHLSALRNNDEPVSADLLAALAKFLGADADRWLIEAGFQPQPILDLITQENELLEYFLAQSRMARHNPEKLRHMKDATRKIWQGKEHSSAEEAG